MTQTRVHPTCNLYLLLFSLPQPAIRSLETIPNSILPPLLLPCAPLTVCTRSPFCVSRYVGDEVERCKQLFDEKEARLKTARDKALAEADDARRERDKAQRCGKA